MSAAPSPEVAAQSFTEERTVHVPDDMSSTYTAPRSVPPQSSERAPTARSGTASPFTSPMSATADLSRDVACPISTRGGTRLVRLVRGKGGGGGGTADPKRHAPPVQSCAKPPAPSAILTCERDAACPISTG